MLAITHNIWKDDNFALEKPLFNHYQLNDLSCKTFKVSTLFSYYCGRELSLTEYFSGHCFSSPSLHTDAQSRQCRCQWWFWVPYIWCHCPKAEVSPIVNFTSWKTIKVQRSCRFKYHISRPKLCCKWGMSVKNGKNFTGLVGDLFNEYTDIGWANLFFSLERSQIIDYTEPYIVEHGGFMVKTKWNKWSIRLKQIHDYTVLSR